MMNLDNLPPLHSEKEQTQKQGAWPGSADGAGTSFVPAPPQVQSRPALALKWGEKETSREVPGRLLNTTPKRAWREDFLITLWLSLSTAQACPQAISAQPLSASLTFRGTFPAGLPGPLLGQGSTVSPLG